MKLLSFRGFAACLVAATLAVPVAAAAQVQVSVSVPVLTIQVARPLVWVVPGVWVLPDSEDEVFYSNGWYWAYHQDHWYRSRGHQHGWRFVHQRGVPRRLRVGGISAHLKLSVTPARG